MSKEIKRGPFNKRLRKIYEKNKQYKNKKHIFAPLKK